MIKDSGYELDALVAKKVMRCNVFDFRCYCRKPTFHGRRTPNVGEYFLENNQIKFYSTEMAAAWEVVEELRSRGFLININEHIRFSQVQIEKLSEEGLRPGTWDLVVESTDGESAPHAICLAALNAVGSI